jgi:methylase of polypeptide subunit release factors
LVKNMAFRGDAEELGAVLRKLAASGYDEAGVAERLGVEDVAALNWRAIPIYRAARLQERDRQALAIELFLLQGSLTAGEAGQLFDGGERELLERAGILEWDGRARARASLFPVGKRLIFADHAWPELPHPGYRTPPGDSVMAVGLDSRRLARCTVRRRVGAALDLCTGSGVQAVLAAEHAGKVTAVDINPRAAEFARWNAAAAGLRNVEVRTGDLFEPVKGERFELITANPPFVASPLDSLGFRDGGSSGEEVQRRIVEGIPEHLAAGGMAQMVTELGEREGEGLAGRVRAWLNGAAMDIHVLRLSEHAAERYAVGHAKGEEYGEFLGSVGEWYENLRAQGYARMVSVVISLQWSDGRCGGPWEREDRSAPPVRAAGEEIAGIFAAERIARRGDLGEMLTGWRLRRAGPIALMEARVLGGGVRGKRTAALLGRALRVEHELSEGEAALLERVSGEVEVMGEVEEVRALIRKGLVVG